MRFALERVTQPSIEPVTLSQMIQQVHEFSSLPQAAQDDLTGKIVAAREWAEHFTGRALIEQQWKITYDRRGGTGPSRFLLPLSFPEGNGYGWYTGECSEQLTGYMLRKSPVIAITAVNLVADDGTETEVAAAEYRVEGAATKWPTIIPASGSSWGDVFRVSFRAGYAPAVGSPDPVPDPALVPVRFAQAIRLHAEAHYDRDKDMMQKLLDAAENLITPERVELSLA